MTNSAGATGLDTEFHRGLGLYDSTMVVVGSMIGSGIFIVSADMGRNIGSPGWLLGAWILTGLLTVVGAMLEEQIPDACCSPAQTLAAGEGPERYVCCSSGQCLGYELHQQEVGRACENEPASQARALSVV